MDPIQWSHAKLLVADLLTLTVHPSNLPTFSRNGRRVSRAEIVGAVVAVDRTTKFLKFSVDDGSGCIHCILWLNHHLLLAAAAGASSSSRGPSSDGDLTAEMAREQAEVVRLGGVVRVRGRIGVFRNRVQITVGDVVEERDPNMEVLHWLDCIRLARFCYDVPPS